MGQGWGPRDGGLTSSTHGYVFPVLAHVDPISSPAGASDPQAGLQDMIVSRTSRLPNPSWELRMDGAQEVAPQAGGGFSPSVLGS